MDLTVLKSLIIDKAHAAGFDQIAVIPVLPFDQWEQGVAYRSSIDPHTADYWSSRGLTHDCMKVMPDSKSIIIASNPYLPYKRSYSEGKGYYNAHYKAYPDGRARMEALGKLIIDEGYKALTDPPLPIKEAAYRSGIGYYGKNGLIHNSKNGSTMTLHMLLTNAELPWDEITEREISDCGSCTRCIDACPTNAISKDGVVIISKCLRYYMLSTDIIPIEVREMMDNRILGCEDCQACCTKNNNRYKQAVNPEGQIFDFKEILAAQKTGLKKHMEAIGSVVGKNYARAQRILSMAVIAAGNSRDESCLPYLKECLKHSHPPIRAHSAWAIGKIGGNEAEKLLMTAEKEENDPKVVGEIRTALKRLYK